MSDLEELIPLRRYLQSHAVTAKAQGRDDRDWLDALHLLDQAESRLAADEADRDTALWQLSDAATPGPWDAEVGGSEGYYVFGPRGLHEGYRFRRDRLAAVTWGSFDQDKANAALIVAAVNYVRDMLAGGTDE